MKEPLIIITALLYSPFVFSQSDSITIDLLPTRSKTDITLIVSEGDVMRYEAYHLFKGNYWMSMFDTLQMLDNGTLQGRKISIGESTSRKRIDASDSVINQIRNAAFLHRTSKVLQELYRKETGIVGSRQGKFLEVNKPSSLEEASLHHSLFRSICERWKTEQKLMIQHEKEKKIERLEWIKANPEKINREFISSFLGSYDNCEGDHRAMISLIECCPDDFLLLCKNMADYDFHSVNLTLSSVPKTISTQAAVLQMNNSPIKTYRKRKVMKLLKKHPRYDSQME